VLADLDRAGYEVQTLGIPACAVDAPHRRERVWILAHAPQQRRQRRPVGPGSAKPQGPHQRIARLRRWPAEPRVGRVAYGVPHRVDRLACLGNAVVPQVAYRIARGIHEAMEQEHARARKA
jgi:DNA (cytosine-5)-methyltransferase 1